MITASATEIKRRGVIALEENLKYGPVHIIKNNKLICVVLTESEYQQLAKCEHDRQHFGLAAMLNKPATGKKSRAEIDALVVKERECWEKK